MSTPSFFEEQFGSNSGYVEELFRLYRTDPDLVPDTWQNYFDGLAPFEGPSDSGSAAHPRNGATVSPVAAPETKSATNGLNGSNGAAHSVSAGRSGERKIVELIRAYREYGHLGAAINPLTRGIVPLPKAPELDFDFHRFTAEEAAARYDAPGISATPITPRELETKLKSIYQGPIGFEYLHLVSAEERSWLREKIEGSYSNQLRAVSEERRKRYLKLLIEGELFESELHRKYVGTKRFSLEGGESLIPMLDTLCERGAELGVREFHFGMAHRGRLNVLANTLGKPLEMIFSEFEDRSLSAILGAGDVKYHLGYQSRRQTGSGHSIYLTLAPNPSHLEFVNPVVEGISRARQDLEFASDRSSVCPVLIHGEAAFAGQGVVFETINLAYLEGYRTGGTVHVIINNQIGFTTTPDEARSTAYCTDLAKGVGAPVFHVNGEDIEACCWAIECGIEFRQKFGRDVLIDLVCYRKYGHNEGDDPSFTQPVAYSEIRAKKTVYALYGERLSEAGTIPADTVQKLVKEYKEKFEEGQARKDSVSPGEACAVHGRLRNTPTTTAVALADLERVAATIRSYPEGFTPHPKLDKLLEKRVETLQDGKGIEWGFAEGLAYGSLVLDGVRIRLSGQDCGRGTFSQRHLLLDDYEGKPAFSPLKLLEQGGGSFEVVNSALSEIAVMGFEFGYAATAPKSLVLWEGQFGDFANGAQVIIDQFISSSEAKWQQLSGIVLLLPHAYEGQGPEHSSARLERFLQLCAEGNMQVCYPTTASQYFHMLRRHALSDIKRPLVVMTPKSLLRLPQATSRTEELTGGGFSPILSTKFGGGPRSTTVFLSGKVYYDVAAALEKAESKPSVRVVRLEQLYPLPEGEIQELLADTEPSKVVWLQEEPQNMGGWSYMREQFDRRFGLRLEYVGRDPSASTAAGSSKRHQVEQHAFLERLIELVS